MRQVLKKYFLVICSFLLIITFFGISNSALAEVEGSSKMSLKNTLHMKLKSGLVVIEMLPKVAPNHVKRIKELVRKGFYDGLSFHRVIPGFMAQTGDPLGNGSGGSGQNIKAEFSNQSHIRGTVSMARAMNPDSADSQFFICFKDTPHLDKQYTVWGQVVEGMDNIDKIKAGDAHDNGSVEMPDTIISLTLVSDVKKSASKSKK